MERRTFSIAVLASLLPAALYARVDENPTVVSYKTHRGWRVWNCTQRMELHRVRWADRETKELAWLDSPPRIDYERGEVIENVTCGHEIVFVHDVKLVLLDPGDDPVKEANRAIAAMAARKGHFIDIRLPEQLAAYRDSVPAYATSVVIVR